MRNLRICAFHKPKTKFPFPLPFSKCYVVSFLRSGVRNVGILVTDGYANINEFNVIPEAENAKRANIEMFSVAVGQNPNLAELNTVASDPDSEHVYQMRTLADVERTTDQLLDYLCS